MKVFFVESTPSDSACLPFASLTMTVNWRRPLAVAVAAALTALLHGLLLIWYLNRPVPQVLTEAVPLPMIDIALEAENAGAPAKTVAPPTPPTPKPVVKPPEKKHKPKPKPFKKPKAESEIKKHIEKNDTQLAEELQQQSASPVNQQAANNPVTGSHANSLSQRSQTST